MQSPFLILAAPGELFQRIELKTPRIAPLAFCALGLYLVTWLGGCWTNIADGLRLWSLLAPATFSVASVIVLAHASTALIFVACRIAGGPLARPAGYQTLFSLNSHCALIIVLGELVNFLLVRLDAFQNLISPTTGRFPLGLDLLLLGSKEPNIYMTLLLHGSSVFVLWYLIVLARGIKSLTGTSSPRAAAVAGSLWIIGLAFVSGIIYSSGGGTVFRIAL